MGITDDTQNTTRINDAHINAVRPLASPALPLDELPMPANTQTLVEDTRRAISNILHDRDDQLLLVVGPCSIHDHNQAFDYARHLKATADALKDDLPVVIRVYSEKPRTMVGWKEYTNDPRLDGSLRISERLRATRQLLLDVNVPGLPAVTGFLNLLSPQYIADFIAWGATGTRTTESQSHQQLASGLSCPIGFKNGTDGSVQVTSDAIIAARASHAFMGMTKMGMAAIFETRGGDDVHVILRDSKDGLNYDSEHIEVACATPRAIKLREQVMVNCSHADSNRSHERQIDIAQDLTRQLSQGKRRIVDVMVGSNLETGYQDLRPGVPLKYDMSIIDVYLGWTQTEFVLDIPAEAVWHRHAYSYDG